MNIALFTDTYIPEINGVATSVNSLYKVLKKNGHNVYVVTTSKNSTTTFEDDIIRIPGLELKKLYGYRLAFIYNSKAYKIIKKLNIQLCHINTDFGIGKFGLFVAKKINAATVYTYHTMYEDYTYYVTQGYIDRFSKWTIREFTKDQILSTNEIISPSEKTKYYLRSIGIDKYVNIVPTGFDFSRFDLYKNKDEILKTIKKRHRIDEDCKILLCLGRIAKEKSFDIIIKGYAKYLKNNPKFKTKLLICGDGPDKNDLIELSEELQIADNCIFVGKVPFDQTQEYYVAGDIFLNASISETQGLTFMEAMASKVIVLCRFDYSLLGVVSNKINGFFFTDENDLGDHIDEVLSLNNEDKNIILNNAFNSIDRFSERSFYNSILEVYKRALRRNW